MLSSPDLDRLAAHFYQEVLLPYHHFLQVHAEPVLGDNRDRAAALAVVIALYHLREHLPAAVRQSRAQVAAQCPDYDLIADITNAVKHGTLTHGSPQIRHATDVYETLVSTTFHDEHGDYIHARKAVEVTLLTGAVRDVHELMVTVLNMWLVELTRLGAIDERPPYSLPRPMPVARSAAKSIGLSITQGIRWEQKMRFQVFNNVTQEFEGLRIDGSKLVFTIRKGAV